MAGIYIHIPFCKKACSYCDFYFSTSLKQKDSFIDSLLKEIELKKHFFEGENIIDTIYFGGGTPSLLSSSEINKIYSSLKSHFDLGQIKEVTLECNPDDLDDSFLTSLINTPINRLSIGVQSFFDSELSLMNRSHNSEEAIEAIKKAQSKGYNNISVDLIYGTPGSTIESCRQNINKILELNIKHISTYCLTIEPNTALNKWVMSGKVVLPDDELSKNQYFLIIEEFEKAGYHQYELSNFSKLGFKSKHNSAYWKREEFLGLGPSAHSFSNNKRSWNVSNNIKYIKKLSAEETPTEDLETLSKIDVHNEIIMTGLRTIQGVDLKDLNKVLDGSFLKKNGKTTASYLEKGLMYKNGDYLRLTKEGLFLSDSIISSLFLTDE